MDEGHQVKKDRDVPSVFITVLE